VAALGADAPRDLIEAGQRRFRVAVAADAPNDVGEPAEAASQILAPDAAAVRAVGDDFVVPAFRLPRLAGYGRRGIAEIGRREDDEDAEVGGDVEHALGVRDVRLVRREEIARRRERLV